MNRLQSSRLPGRCATRWIAEALAWSWVLSAWSQGSPGPAASGFRIAGRVVNSSTGEPVARATVTALSGQDNNRPAASAQSDADGRFSIDHLPPGKYPLTASKRVFRTAFYEEHENFNSAIVTGQGQDTEQLQFGLAPAAVLHGVVTGDGGDPVESANVMLFRRPDPDHPGERTMQVDGTTTDDTGAYEFGNLPAGEYYVAVKAEPWYALHHRVNRSIETAGSNLDVAYPITYFDSTIDEASAASITLGEGSREEANVNLHVVPALHLRLLESPRRRGQRPLELRESVFGNQIPDHGVLAVQHGIFEAGGIAPGHYELIHGDPPRTVEVDATSDLEVDANAGTPAVAVTGTLQGSGGAVIAEDANVLLEPADNARKAPLQTFARKGQFQFENVLQGRWSIAVYAGVNGQALPVMSTTSGQHVSPGNEIAVADQPLHLAVAVSRAQTRVQGFARMDGKPICGVMVVLVPRAPGTYLSLVRRDQSDSDGSFSLHDVAPGQYTLIAIEDGWKLDWQRRDAIARYLAGGVPLTVGDRPEAVIQLTQPVSAVPR
jgi:hypothetical protein